MAIYKKIPNWPAMASVYAVSVFFIYGWTIYWFLWKLPSWTYYLSIPEIFLIAVYSAAANLFESLLVFCAPLVLALIFPKQWFADHFVPVGGFLSILIGGFLIYFSSVSEKASAFSYLLLAQVVVFFAVSVFIAILAGRIRVVASIVELFSDRLKIFLYISFPVSIISLLIVIIRNLLG